MTGCILLLVAINVCSFFHLHIHQQVFIQDCSAPGGMPGAGDADVSVDKVRESISEENDEKEADMGKSGERDFQVERTTGAKALR